MAGLEPTASASAGLRSIQLSYKRPFLIVLLIEAIEDKRTKDNDESTCQVSDPSHWRTH